MKTITSKTNLTNPGVEPAEGDQVKIVYSDGSSKTITYQEINIDLPEPSRRIVTVSAFEDRLNINNKMETIYRMIKEGEASNDFTMRRLLDNIRGRLYIDLDEGRLEPTLRGLQIYTDEELTHIFKDANDIELSPFGEV